MQRGQQCPLRPRPETSSPRPQPSRPRPRPRPEPSRPRPRPSKIGIETSRDWDRSRDFNIPAKCLKWVGDLPEWVGFHPPSLHVKVALGDGRTNLSNGLQARVTPKGDTIMLIVHLTNEERLRPVRNCRPTNLSGCRKSVPETWFNSTVPTQFDSCFIVHVEAETVTVSRLII